MYRIPNQFLAVILVCLFFTFDGAIVQADETVLEYEIAYTLQDNDLDGQADVIFDPLSGSFGQITNSPERLPGDLIDEFFIEFDISESRPACSAKFNFSFTTSYGPAELPYDLNLAVYEGECEYGDQNLGNFGKGQFLEKITISSIGCGFSVDVTDVLNDFINSGKKCFGLRLYEPISQESPQDIAQLVFDKGNLTLVPRDVLELVDIMHPAGSVNAYPNLLWPPNKKNVKVNFEGYIIDEMSMVRDGEGIGVSQAYLLVNGKEIILRDKTTDLLNPDGSFSIVERLRAKKGAIYKVELYAADTVPEKDGGPNFGLVDSTSVQVPHDMSGKSKDKYSNSKNKERK